MKILLVNGNPDFNNHYFDAYVNALEEELMYNGHEIEQLSLKNLAIKSCTGCWACWVKTPGECIVEDDTYQLREKMIHADLVLFGSPMVLRFISALLKKAMDKLIPLLHPYVELVEGECHHSKRYDHYPLLGYFLQKEEDTDKEDLTIVDSVFRRFALNFKSQVVISAVVEVNNPKEISHAINYL